MVRKIDSGTLMAKKAYTASAMGKANVVGVGIGYKVVEGKQTKDEAIAVFVEKKQPLSALAEKDRIDEVVVISGVDKPVDVVEIGRIEALTARTDRWRPAPGGVSVGHYKITAGTLGVAVRERMSGLKMFLSNNHVIANSNDAYIGDAIFQPGPIDGGTKEDIIAVLANFIQIDFGEDDPTCNLASLYIKLGNLIAKLTGSSHRLSARKYSPLAVNRVDAAIARPTHDDIITSEVEQIGIVENTAEAFLGMKVAKSGRTTEYTTGTIEYINATVQVNYGAGKIATFEDQLISGFMSQGGDSGSLLVEIGTRALHPRAVGLLFAGSNNSTIYSPIQFVFDALNIELW